MTDASSRGNYRDLPPRRGQATPPLPTHQEPPVQQGMAAIPFQQALQNTPGRFIGFADFNHANLNLRRPIFSLSSLQDMRAAGITDIAVEMPREFQSAVDQYMRGRIGRAQMETVFAEMNFMDSSGSISYSDRNSRQQNIDLQIGLLDNARTSGLRIHYIDSFNHFKNRGVLTDDLMTNES